MGERRNTKHGESFSMKIGGKLSVKLKIRSIYTLDLH